VNFNFEICGQDDGRAARVTGSFVISGLCIGLVNQPHLVPALLFQSGNHRFSSPFYKRERKNRVPCNRGRKICEADGGEVLANFKMGKSIEWSIREDEISAKKRMDGKGKQLNFRKDRK